MASMRLSRMRMVPSGAKRMSSWMLLNHLATLADEWQYFQASQWQKGYLLEYPRRCFCFQKIKIPSFKMRFLNRGFKFWWLRTMSTEEPVASSKNPFASISKNGLGVFVSTNKSISLPSFCSSLAVEPNRDKDVMPYLSLSMSVYFFNSVIHSSFVIFVTIYSLQSYKLFSNSPNFNSKRLRGYS